jgi:hypothetical protein
MFISQGVIGWGALILGLALTFFFPLGQRRGNHLISELILILLFVTAAYNLIPVEWVPRGEDWKVIVIGLGAGLIAVIIRDIRRFFRFFHGRLYRMSHPYYWYSRAFGRRRRYY